MVNFRENILYEIHGSIVYSLYSALYTNSRSILIKLWAYFDHLSVTFQIVYNLKFCTYLR